MYSLCIKDTRAQNQWGNYFLSSASSAPSKAAYWTGAIQLQKGEQHLGKLHRETVPCFLGTGYYTQSLTRTVDSRSQSVNVYVVSETPFSVKIKFW